MPTDDDVGAGEMRRWLERVEKKVDALDTEVRASFAGLAYVSQREYEKDRRTDREYSEETRSIATAARAFNWAMFALVATAVVASLYAILRSV